VKLETGERLKCQQCGRLLVGGKILLSIFNVRSSLAILFCSIFCLLMTFSF